MGWVWMNALLVVLGSVGFGAITKDAKQTVWTTKSILGKAEIAINAILKQKDSFNI